MFDESHLIYDICALTSPMKKNMFNNYFLLVNDVIMIWQPISDKHLFSPEG